MDDLPDKVALSQIELLELKNHLLQEKILDMEREKILVQKMAWIARVNMRLRLDINKYSIDISNGECILRKELEQTEN